MRDTRQLELNFHDDKVPLTSEEQDAIVGERLALMSVRVYVCAVARSQRTWADTKAPSIQELIHYRDHLDSNPQDTGHYYRDVLEELILEKLPVWS